MHDYIIQALHGDHNAFGRVYDTYAASALRLSMSITRDSALAQDAVQEAFLRVYRKGRQFRQNEAFEPWFYRIVINESKRVLKQRPHEPALNDFMSVSSFTDQGDSLVNITAAMATLSEEHRTVLTLKFVLDHSEAAIAGIIKKPLGTVKSRIHYAKKSLALQLGRVEEPASAEKINS
ncbi:MAG: sigma-70 family RNA polymerase sigma factor [Peptococcaceae bacterium]|nr:sigma-70 family RNA polymerase sigma factor [Peptococcaceae bacterium]